MNNYDITQIEFSGLFLDDEKNILNNAKFLSLYPNKRKLLIKFYDNKRKTYKIKKMKIKDYLVYHPSDIKMNCFKNNNIIFCINCNSHFNEENPSNHDNHILIKLQEIKPDKRKIEILDKIIENYRNENKQLINNIELMRNSNVLSYFN